MCIFCKSMLVLLSFFFWSLCCLSCDLQILITPLVSSNHSYRLPIALTTRPLLDLLNIEQTRLFRQHMKHPTYLTLLIIYIFISKWSITVCFYHFLGPGGTVGPRGPAGIIGLPGKLCYFYRF